MPEKLYDIKVINRGRRVLFSKVGDFHGILIAVKIKLGRNILDCILRNDAITKLRKISTGNLQEKFHSIKVNTKKKHPTLLR